jgi:hypothetical protein
MVEIRNYVRKFQPPSFAKQPAPDDRFVVYAAGTPALMIEFFDNDYHIYGPAHKTLDGIFDNLLLVVGAIFRTDGISTISSGRSLYYLLRNDRLNIDALWATIDGDIRTRQTSSALGNRFRGDPIPILELFWAGIKDLRSSIPSDAAYLSLTIRELGLVLWADIHGSVNPRSGIALGSTLFSRAILPVLRSFTTTPWRDEEDGEQVVDFVNERWRG